MSKLDWQLMKTLRYDAQRPTGRIARELGITYRMADYGIRRLFESRTVSVRAIINARDPKGIIFYSVNLVVDEQKREHIARELRRIFGKRLWWTVDHSGPAVIVFLFANSVGRAEDDLLEALSKPGVASGTITIFKGWVEPERPSWIDRALVRRSKDKSPEIRQESNDCKRRQLHFQPDYIGPRTKGKSCHI